MSDVLTPTPDPVFEGFLERQAIEGMELASRSDVLDLVPLAPPPCPRYLAVFRAPTLVEDAPGVAQRVCNAEVQIWFPSTYLRQADTFQVLSWRGPRAIFHPNINGKAGVICIGRVVPGTRLVDILYQVYELVTWRNIQMNERDALDPRACAWARSHQDQFPLEAAPLTRPVPREPVQVGGDQ